MSQRQIRRSFLQSPKPLPAMQDKIVYIAVMARTIHKISGEAWPRLITSAGMIMDFAPDDVSYRWEPRIYRISSLLNPFPDFALGASGSDGAYDVILH